MDIFINSAEAITAQKTFDTEELFSGITEPENGYFVSQVPEYKKYINPRLLRRMSNLVRMGVACSLKVLETAGVKQPDAIITGTGLGCLTDTVKFLDNMIEENETLLNPTAFIQSVHNTVSGQIALLLGCKNYNFTFSQQSVSFETALLDAVLKLSESGINNVLLGGLDEINDKTFNLLSRMGCVKKQDDDVFLSGTKGYIPGEGAAFFVLSNEKSDLSLARISGSAMFETAEGTKLPDGLVKILEENGLVPDDIDLLISSYNGDATLKSEYNKINELLGNSNVAYFKHLTGEFDTASAVAMWLGVISLQKQSVHPALVISGSGNNREIKNVLVHSYSKDHKHSFILISGC